MLPSFALYFSFFILLSPFFISLYLVFSSFLASYLSLVSRQDESGGYGAMMSYSNEAAGNVKQLFLTLCFAPGPVHPGRGFWNVASQAGVYADRARSIAAKISSSSGKRNCFNLENTSVPSIRTSKAPPLPSMSRDVIPYLS
jgi:hypothetical protein